MLFHQVAVTLVVSTAFAAKALHRRTACNSGVYVLSARGTGELSNSSRLDGIVRAITTAIPNSFGEEVQYPASYDFVPSVATGLGFVSQRITDYASQCPDRSVVLIGYSQGAAVTEIYLAGTDLFNTSWPPLNTKIGKNVAAVIQIGDPTRVPGQGLNALGPEGCTDAPPLTRKGQFKTAMDFYADRLLDFCDAGDMVCCGTGHNAAAHVSYFTQNTTDTIVDFVKQQYAKSSHSSNGTSTNSTAPPASSVSATVSVVSPSASSTTSSPAVNTGMASSIKCSVALMISAGCGGILMNL